MKRYAHAIQLLIIAGLSPAALAQTVWYVDQSASGAGNGTSWSAAFRRLQSALAEAVPGDQVWVAGGHYHPTPCDAVDPRLCTFSISEGVEVYGGFPPSGGNGTFQARNPNPLTNDTALCGDLTDNDIAGQFPDGPSQSENSYHVVTISGDVGAVLDGFTIEAGNANGSNAIQAGFGGGLYFECQAHPCQVRVSRCRFQQNNARDAGGAVYLRGEGSAAGPEVLFDACLFLGNSSGVSGSLNGGSGGALAVEHVGVKLESTTLSFNKANAGGAIYAAFFSGLIATRSVLEHNEALSSGGGAYFDNSSTSVFVNCFLRGNASAFDGGAILSQGDIRIANCVASGNTAGKRGGAFLLGDVNGNSGTVDIRGCTIYRNRANNIEYVPPTTDCSMEQTCGGGGIYVTEPCTISNTILWDNLREVMNNVVKDDDAQINFHANTPTITHSCIQDWVPSVPAVIINDDPSFVDPEGPDDILGTSDDNLRLQTGSVCADRGDDSKLAMFNIGLVSPQFTNLTTDIDQDARQADDPTAPPVGMIVDMGAYESFSGDAALGTVFVDVAASGMTGASWADAVNDLQSALDLANDPLGLIREIWVAAGTYRPSAPSGRSATFQLRNSLAIYGGFDGTETSLDDRACRERPDLCEPGDQTILDGDLLDNDRSNFSNYTDNSFHVVTASGTGLSAILDGFLIRGGNADGGNEIGSIGGGILVDVGAGADIRNCVLRENRAAGVTGGGGALGMANQSSPRILNCRFEDNSASLGGAVFGGDGNAAIFVNCEFSDNFATLAGGAMELDPDSTTRVKGCSFTANTAEDGGAVHNNQVDLTSFDNCLFKQNIAVIKGGALGNAQSTITLVNSVFLGNTALGPPGLPVGPGGGAVSLVQNSALTATNCLFSGNSATVDGGALFIEDSLAMLSNCTFSENSVFEDGGGVFISDSSDADIANCIIWNNSDSGGMDESAQIHVNHAIDKNYSCILGFSGGSGVGNIGSDPLFVDADGADNMPGTTDDDLRLTLYSPAIDSASNPLALVSVDTTDLDGDGDTCEPAPLDLDGNPRFVDYALAPNAGSGGGGLCCPNDPNPYPCDLPPVDMGAYEFPVADCDFDGIDDSDEIDAGAPDCDEDGIPDTASNLCLNRTCMKDSDCVDGECEEGVCRCSAHADCDSSPGQGDGRCILCELDRDRDGHIDDCDFCPDFADPTNTCEDADGDGELDSMDNCPNVANSDQLDQLDMDGVGDACDNCLTTPNGPDLGVCSRLTSPFCAAGRDCPYGECLGGLCVCQDDADCEALPEVQAGGGQAVCILSQTNSDDDLRGDACDNCPFLFNPNQADSDSDGFGDACGSELGLGARLEPPPELADLASRANSRAEIPANPDWVDPGEIEAWTTDHLAAFYHPVENAWFATEPQLVRMTWNNANNIKVGESLFLIPDAVATNDWTVGVRYFLDYNEDQFDQNASVVLDSPFHATIRYNSTILEQRQMPGTNPPQFFQFPDFHMLAGQVIAEDHCPEGKVLIQHDTGPGGEFVGFEVVEISRFGTPPAQAVAVGRRLALPAGTDGCRAVFISNSEVNGTPAAWQRGFESADVYPLRPEALPSNFVVAWYKRSALPGGQDLGNCWTRVVKRYTADWPTDPQFHIVVKGAPAVADGSIVDLRVGSGDFYCAAEVMYQQPFNAQQPVSAQVVAGSFSALNPGYSVVRFDIDPPGVGACGADVMFEVVASIDHQTDGECIAGLVGPCDSSDDCETGVGADDGVCADVYLGAFPAMIGDQVLEPQPIHDTATPLYPYGYVHAGQPYAASIYDLTGQIFPVNASMGTCLGGDSAGSACLDNTACPNGTCAGAHGLIEAWWFQAGRDCRCGMGTCMGSGANDGNACDGDGDCGCTGNFAPGVYWPHKSGEYGALWPQVYDTSEESRFGEIVIASRQGASHGNCGCVAGNCAGSGTQDGSPCLNDPECCVVEYDNDAALYSAGSFSSIDEERLSLAGWNPNDEHAILLPIGEARRVFAVRDDDPWRVASGHPYVLIQRPSAGDSSLREMDVFIVKGEDDDCSDGVDQGEDCLDFTDAEAGQPIEPLYPVNFGSPLCDDGEIPSGQLTFVDGDAAWQDRKGGLWAVEEIHDGKILDVGTCSESTGQCIGGSDQGELCGSDSECRDQLLDDGLNDLNDPSFSEVYLWENWAPDYGCQPWRAFAANPAMVPAGVSGFCQDGSNDGALCTDDPDCTGGGTCRFPYPIVHRATWPDVPPDCNFPNDPNCARPLLVGEAVDQSLQCGSITLLHDSVGARVIDPTLWVGVDLSNFPLLGINLAALPPHLFDGEIGGGGEFPDRIRFDLFSNELQFRGIMSDRDHAVLLGLSTDQDWTGAIDSLYMASREQLSSPFKDSAAKFVTVGDASAKPGWITLAFQNDQDCVDLGLPVSVEVWRVDCPPAQGSIRVIQPQCVFSEQQVLQFSGDLGGEPENVIFQWQYSLEGPDGPWNNYNPPPDYGNGTGLREVLIEGASQFTLVDTYWRVRYRGYEGCPCTTGPECSGVCPDLGVCADGPNDGMSCSSSADCPLGTCRKSCVGGAQDGQSCVVDEDCPDSCCPGNTSDNNPEHWASFLASGDNTQVSDWTDSQLAEGWIKRLVRGLNPFDQRIEDFHNNPAATFVHMIQQAGIRFEQNVALNCAAENINSIGLIEAYSTALGRVREFTVDGVGCTGSDPPASCSCTPAFKAIQLVASKIADLYMLLGNEAYADGLDPTIGLFFDQGDPPAGYDPHAVFCFENQVLSLLEEELALLRGVGDMESVQEPTTNADNQVIATVYNRLPWNFTSGDGQVAYANNYQVTDVEEALSLYPQGHGDAWGHYLTAAKQFYTLLKHPVFEWQVTTEDVLVAGQPVAVGFKYERKFAQAAAAKARAGSAIVAETFRQMYTAEPTQQFGYPDSDAERAWGVTEWARRAGQAAYFDWVVGNAILPDNAVGMHCSNASTLNCTNAEDCVVCNKQGECQQGFCEPDNPPLACAVSGATCSLDMPCLVNVCSSGTCSESGEPCSDENPCDVNECGLSSDHFVCADTQVICASHADCSSGLCVPNSEFINSIRKIDRTTVPDLRDIAAAYSEIQSVVDNADAGLNPLGLATNVVPFGLDPDAINEGQTHFDQIYQRAVAALGNAVTAFNYANENTRRLRAVQDQVDQFDDLVEERELDFKARLVDVFGRPYPEDIGVNGTYPTGYDGPDIYHFGYVDPSNIIPQSDATNTTTITVEFNEPQVDPFTGALTNTTIPVTFNVSTDGLGLIKPEDWSERIEPGEIQFARSELLQAVGRYEQALDRYEAQIDQVEAQRNLLESQFELNANILQVMLEGQEQQQSLNQQILIARSLQMAFRTLGVYSRKIGEADSECLPTKLISGLATGGDFTAPLRCAKQFVETVLANQFDVAADAAGLVELAIQHDKEFVSSNQQIIITGFQQNFAIEQQIEVLRNLVRQMPQLRIELYILEEAINQATGRYSSAIGGGLRLLEQRTAFRQRTADQISQHRYRDMAFRVFRNEALQKYRAQFDLAARYVYLAAKTYDYETNLLGANELSGRQFLTDIVKERTLGVVNGGTPLIGNGLAGRLAEMFFNFDLVLRPQLGFNSPAELNRVFSLRWELFGIPETPGHDDDWAMILGGMIVSSRDRLAMNAVVLSVTDINDFMELPEYQQYCKPLLPEIEGNPAIVIKFSTVVNSGQNFFGLTSQGDEVYPSTYDAIKLHAIGVRFVNYPLGTLNNQAEVYLIPLGADVLRVPGDGSVREWHLLDQTLPVPFPLGEADLEDPAWSPWDSTVGGSQAAIRRRLYPTVTGLPAQGSDDEEDLRFFLTGRSVWNTRWMLIIPGSELYGVDPVAGIDIFRHGPVGAATGVRDIQLIFNSYGYSGSPKPDAPGDGGSAKTVRSDDP